jgi:hypothetical protein
MADVAARSRAHAHAEDARGTETRWTVAALPVLGTPSVSSLSPSTLSTSESGGPRISMRFRSGIGHTGGRPRRLCTGLIVCGICAAELRASSRTRHELRYGPPPRQAWPYTERQPVYVCPDLRHISILATETEQRVGELVERRTGRKADRAGIASAVLRIVVSPGRPGLARFDPYRLRVVWQPMYDQAGAVLAGPATYERS